MLNCGLFYRGTMETATGKRRVVQEIAKTLGTSDEGAREALNTALAGVRQHSLIEAVDSAAVNRYTLVAGSRVCVSCSRIVDNPYKIVSKKFTYCSKTCLREKPVAVLVLEHKYRTDVRNVLRIARSLFKTIPIVASVLKIQRSLLVKYYEYYLGVKASDFGVDIADIVDLLRKRSPASATDEFISVPLDKLQEYPVWARLESEARALAKSL